MIVEGISGVPKYECTQYQEKQSDYCVLIPIINEGERIAKVLRIMVVGHISSRMKQEAETLLAELA